MQVITMAMISLPIMMRYRYNIRYITDVLAASGTITQLLPPSRVMVALSNQLKTQTAAVDVDSMYLGARGPPLVQIFLLVQYTFLLYRIKPDRLSTIPKDWTLQGWAFWEKCLQGIAPSAVLIFMVLGTMMLGIAVPTESGATDTLDAVILAVLRSKSFGVCNRQAFHVSCRLSGDRLADLPCHADHGTA